MTPEDAELEHALHPVWHIPVGMTYAELGVGLCGVASRVRSDPFTPLELCSECESIHRLQKAGSPKK